MRGQRRVLKRLRPEGLSSHKTSLRKEIGCAKHLWKKRTRWESKINSVCGNQECKEMNGRGWARRGKINHAGPSISY